MVGYVSVCAVIIVLMSLLMSFAAVYKIAHLCASSSPRGKL